MYVNDVRLLCGDDPSCQVSMVTFLCARSVCVSPNTVSIEFFVFSLIGESVELVQSDSTSKELFVLWFLKTDSENVVFCFGEFPEKLGTFCISFSETFCISF